MEAVTYRAQLLAGVAAIGLQAHARMLDLLRDMVMRGNVALHRARGLCDPPAAQMADLGASVAAADEAGLLSALQRLGAGARQIGGTPA